MDKTIKVRTSKSARSSRPALTPEARQNQMIAKAINLAEKQLDEGTASSQVVTHFLKLGTVQAQLELEKTKKEIAMLEAKSEALKSAKNVEGLFKDALAAFRGYSGQDEGGSYEDYDD